VPTKIHHFLVYLMIRSIMKGLPLHVIKCLFLAAPQALGLLRS